jgi:hypothetical protein
MGTMAGTTVLCTQYPARVTNDYATSDEDDFEEEEEPVTNSDDDQHDAKDDITIALDPPPPIVAPLPALPMVEPLQQYPIDLFMARDNPT